VDSVKGIWEANDKQEQRHNFILSIVVDKQNNNYDNLKMCK